MSQGLQQFHCAKAIQLHLLSRGLVGPCHAWGSAVLALASPCELEKLSVDFHFSVIRVFTVGKDSGLCPTRIIFYTYKQAFSP